jgi:hypothetical protein
MAEDNAQGWMLLLCFTGANLQEITYLGKATRGVLGGEKGYTMARKLCKGIFSSFASDHKKRRFYSITQV